MSRTARIALGIVTILPLVGFAVFFIVMLSMAVFFPLAAMKGRVEEPPMLPFLIFPLHVLNMALILGLMVFYIVHLFKTNRVPNDQKALCAVVLFLGNALAMPVYWYLYIWREPQAVTETPPSSDTASR